MLSALNRGIQDVFVYEFLPATTGAMEVSLQVEDTSFVQAIAAQVPIEGFAVDFPRLVVEASAFSASASVSAGSDVEYTWDVGYPSSTPVVLTGQYVSFAYPEAGLYTVSARARNGISANRTSFSVLVESPFKDLRLDVCPEVSHRSECALRASVAAGSNPRFAMTVEGAVKNETLVRHAFSIQRGYAVTTHTVALNVSNALFSASTSATVTVFPPRVLSVTPAALPAFESSRRAVTIAGERFGGANSTGRLLCYFGDAMAEAEVLSETLATCRPAPHTPETVRLVLAYAEDLETGTTLADLASLGADFDGSRCANCLKENGLVYYRQGVSVALILISLFGFLLLFVVAVLSARVSQQRINDFGQLVRVSINLVQVLTVFARMQLKLYGHAMLLGLSTAYVLVAQAALSTFACVQDPGSSKAYLVTEPSFECDINGMWGRVLVPIGSLAVVLYVFGVPFGLLCIAVYGKLKKRKLEGASSKSNERTHENLLRDDKFIRSFGFLVLQYNTKYPWCAKLAIVINTLWLVRLPVLQSIVAFIVLFVAAIAQISLKPFTIPRINMLEALSLTASMSRPPSRPTASSAWNFDGPDSEALARESLEDLEVFLDYAASLSDLAKHYANTGKLELSYLFRDEEPYIAHKLLMDELKLVSENPNRERRYIRNVARTHDECECPPAHEDVARLLESLGQFVERGVRARGWPV
eukprot:tig00020904_g15269.t1